MLQPKVCSEENLPQDHVKCQKCFKNVPTANYELHKARCTVQLLNGEELKVKEAKPKKGKKKGGKKEDTGEEDFDSLCSEFQKLDKVCNYPRCS